ncbi:hypothetical protein PEBR_41358 [Penicillium brasilianum]|uniref:F-box domain-containing protein n=1 Tax=Penicillium brasilianum TaxID=104259 RepID=A0A1S9R8N2_PENBI|nr:hypothetical protein PEBR_41358 [Penicillium brasilianum]
MDQGNGYEKALISSKEWAWATNPSNWYDQEVLRRIVASDGADDALALMDLPNLPKRLHVSHAPDTLISAPGTLSALPLEIVFKVIDHLNIKSAELFSQTCRMSRYLLQQHPSYKALLQFAMPLRYLYEKCGLADYNSIYDLGKELQYPKCRCCGHEGTKLYLPFGERICGNCSAYNPAFWCISIRDAMSIFCMSDRQIRELPTIKAKELLWNRGNPLGPVQIDREGLVSAKAAFLAAMDIWGNRETMCRYASAYDNDFDYNEAFDHDMLVAAYWVLRNIQIKTPDDPTQLDGPSIFLPPQVSTVTSVPFPWIPRGNTEAERRYMCRGCEWLSDKNGVSHTLLEYSGINPKLPHDRVKRILAGRREMIYTWKDLMTHVRGCAGAGILMRRYFVERDYEWGPPKRS